MMQTTLFGPEEPISLRGVRWSEADDRRLDELWGVWSIVRIASELGREPSVVHHRAMTLGLPGGVPSGFESVASAAKRLQVTPEFVRRAVWAHNVPTALSLSWLPGEPKIRHVDRELIGDAVAKCKREPPRTRRKATCFATDEALPVNRDAGETESECAGTVDFS